MQGVLSWGRALRPSEGLSTGQLNCCLPRMEEKKRRENLKIQDGGSRHLVFLGYVNLTIPAC